jgi:hypothetical protein
VLEAALVWLAPVALVFSLLALGLALAGSRRSRGAPRSADVGAALEEGDVSGAVAQVAAQLATLQGSFTTLASRVEALEKAAHHAVRHAAVVRFDALEEHTGELSFSLALLDDDQSGVVVTSINGRQQTRMYAKSIVRGRPSVMLSDEEQQAIATALGRR